MAKTEILSNILPEEVVKQRLEIVVPCDEHGQVQESERARLKNIKAPSQEHLWFLALRCNQDGSLLIADNKTLNFANAQEALDYAIKHPDTADNIKVWADIDWGKYGMSGEKAYPTQYEISSVHPEVYKWGDAGYTKYLSAHGLG